MGRPKKPLFQRHDNPPPMGDVLHVARVRDIGHMTVVVISPDLTGFFTHWHNMRTRPCPGRDNGCKLCIDLQARRWVGFVQICNTDHTSHALLECTQLGGNRLKEIREREGSLRGLIIQVGRARPDIKAPMTIEVVGRDINADTLTFPKPIEPTLNRLWGYNG